MTTRGLILSVVAALILPAPSVMANPARTVHTLWVAPVAAESAAESSGSAGRQSDCPPAERLASNAFQSEKKGNYVEAEGLFRQALASAESAVDTQGQVLVDSLLNLARVLCAQGKFDEAQRLCERAVAVAQQNAAMQAWQVRKD